jgi:hypothetical protein
LKTAATLLLCIFVGSIVFAQSQTATRSQKPLARIPFVGCAADGQIGPVEAPAGKSRSLPISAETAGRLAYYKSSEGLGVLAPRGWSCFGLYGSNGYFLYVAPEHLAFESLSGKEFTGPAIELNWESGGTSGRFGVARIIARVFPEHRSFVERVLADGITEPSDFPSGPYPTDQLKYRSRTMVEYETPANAEGLGTSDRLKPSALPVRGVAILVGKIPDLVQLAVRLPPDLTDLSSTTIKQIEDDVEQLHD